ncbi:MAG: M23 family metallopeptidase [Paludibacter sp.]|nr:M23 family metallopeptidase [Bacteroidales bacterium]MCM1068267.1 M23 family metallopeptidase [Prevotella sp.]MCM1354630.1 M23 family metallopeptidase [Bacteroides sp.]MCM1442052.1 M23 family metallopeptidase [Muribaculum sp.]MCM1482054.1 M23 family metallopeptidase [Paludibacter sp.]
MKRNLLLLAGVMLASVMGAQSLPEGMTFEYRNDTLFVTCNADDLPKHLIVKGQDRANIYKRIFNDATDDLMEDHPADDLYNSVWTRERVNPYQYPIDSIRDSVLIDCKGFTLPAKGYITSKFGPRKYRYHYGTDVKVLVGDTIRCSWDGQVRIVKYDPKGYGNYVVVRHDNGLETVYAHMSRVLVEENERIYSGEILGLGGNTGRSTGSHLHYEIRYLGNAINPELFVDFSKGELCDSTHLITKTNTFYHQRQLKEMQQAKYYVVKAGDSLSVIARRYGTSVSAICRLNGIKESSVIRIGQRLRVR